MPAPFETKDEPTYSWRYPDPPPYKPQKMEVDYGLLFMLAIIIMGITVIGFIINTINTGVVEIESDLNRMSCHEFTLNHMLGFLPNPLVIKYMNKCHPEIKPIGSNNDGHIYFRDDDDYRLYFKSLDCQRLGDHIKYNDFAVKLATIENTLRCT